MLISLIQDKALGIKACAYYFPQDTLTFVDAARINLRKAKSNHTPVEIVDSDAAVFEAKEGTVFFMFNPFGKMTLEKVIKNIRQSLLTNPRKTHIAYYCPVYKDLLDA